MITQTSGTGKYMNTKLNFFTSKYIICSKPRDLQSVETHKYLLCEI